MTFHEWLAQNNSSENQWGVWVNPRDVQDYRIGQYCFENGGVDDDWVAIGSLDSLSQERRDYTGEADGEDLVYMEDFSQEWAEQKIEELKEYFAPGGEYEQEQKELEAQKEWWAAGVEA